MMEYPEFKVYCRCFTFNQSKYITDTMNGFTMQQTSFPFVCTIVDDASTDGEQEVIRKYVEDNFDLSEGSVAYNKETDYAYVTYAQHKTNKNCYFVVLYLKENHYSQRKPKMGYLSEWQDICEYEAPCEGDDYWIDKDKLQKQVEVMDNNPNVSLVHTDFYFLEEDTSKMVESKTLQCSSKQDILINIINGNRYRIQTMTTLFRGKDHEKIIQSDDFLYKSRYFLMGDTQLWTGLLEIGDIYCIHTPTSVYRINQGSVSNQNNLKKKYRFNLSCAELRLYLLDKYHIIDNNAFSIISKQYDENFLFYKLYDPKFKPLYKPSKICSILWHVIFLFRLNYILKYLLEKCKK